MIRTGLVLAALMAGSSAQALTYVGSSAVGNSSATYTIVTDGTLGALTAANFVSWSGTVTSASQTQSFTNGNFFNILGGTTTATATQLLFDSSNVGFLAFGNSDGNIFTALCWSGLGASCAGEAGPSKVVAADYADDWELGSVSGTVLVAGVAGAIPEPSTWALMILGFGMAGATMRRRAVRIAYA